METTAVVEGNVSRLRSNLLESAISVVIVGCLPKNLTQISGDADSWTAFLKKFLVI